MVFRLLSMFVSSGVLFGAAASSFPALTYSTYLRDNFTANAIATDSSGNIYLTGNVVVDAATSQTSVLVLKLNPQATELLYTRFLGGSVNDYAYGIAVDQAGNAYIAGVTNSPDFPVTGGSTLGTAPTIPSERSFAAKLDANGELVFSTLLGGSANSFAQSVAVNGAGQVLVSGVSESAVFPTTPGVYSVTNAQSVPYLLEVDPTGTKLIFSATGIGGSAVAFDSSGNIYMAGTTNSLTYPTTAGSYQPVFPMFQTCIAPCHGQFQGPNQYVTKLDPTGTKMIYSTAVSGTGNTMNEGLAVDAAGNVYLTGLAGQGYPYTVATPSMPLGLALDLLATPALPFLSKLDPLGQKLLYSVPVGGEGVKVDASGSAYVGGLVGLFGGYDVGAALPALASVPSGCFLPETTPGQPAAGAYAAQVDGSGNVVGAQYIGGSSLKLTGVALTGTTLWMSGISGAPNYLLTQNTLLSPNLLPNPPAGAYLGAVNFGAMQPPAGTPQVSCIMDGANFEPTGPIAPNQVLTIFGNGLGPSTPVTATDNSSTSLGGVSVNFGSLSAPLLYVSANQINLAVPSLSSPTIGMQVTVNGVMSTPLELAVVSANPTLYSVAGSFQPNLAEFLAVATNADGSLNSATNPAPLGSNVTVFVNGLTANQFNFFSPPAQSLKSSWPLISAFQNGPFVLQVALQVPSSNMNFECGLPNTSACIAGFEIDDTTPFILPGSQPQSVSGPRILGAIYVAQ